MDIQETREGAVTVIKPLGPLVLGDADEFRRRLEDVRQRSLGRFIVDASAIAYVDSNGLEALVGVTDGLAEGGQALRLCSANETVREVLDLTELADQFEFYQDVNTGVRSFL